jgi:hypothetical protein
MMNSTLESTLFDFYINYPTLKCPAIVTKSPEQAVTQQMFKVQEEEAPLQISIQEPHHSVFAWEPLLAFLVVFGPLFLSIMLNADGIIYIFVALLGKLMRVQ